MLSFFLENFSGLMLDAITTGAILGAVAGVIAFTAASASEGLARVFVGIIAGGLIVGVYQALRIGAAAGIIGIDLLDPGVGGNVDALGTLLFDGIVLTLEAAFVGGLIMIVFLAPGRAILGALAGVVMGIIAGLIAWGLLEVVDIRVPQVLFYAMIVGILLVFLDTVTGKA